MKNLLLIIGLLFTLSCKKNNPDPINLQPEKLDTVALICASGCFARELPFTVTIKTSTGTLIKEWSDTLVYDGQSPSSLDPEILVIKLDGIPDNGSYCISYDGGSLFCGGVTFEKSSEMALFQSYKPKLNYYIPNIGASRPILIHAQEVDGNGDPICN